MKITRQRIITYEEEIPGTLSKFKDWEFSSSSIAGEDFEVFVKLFKKYIRGHLPAGAKLHKFNPSHYCLSGFISKGDKFIYFSIPDVRYFPRRWQDNILIRTAKSEQDYTGGSNNYTSLEDFTGDVERLLGKEVKDEIQS